MKEIAFSIACLCNGVFGIFCMAQSETEPTCIEVLQPLRHQVFQRRFDVPQLSHSHHPGGPARGFADVECVLRLERDSKHEIDYRIRTDHGATEEEAHWQRANNLRLSKEEATGTETRIAIPVRAGGWYIIDFRVMLDGELVGQGSSKPFGVGEVFLVAGQSYATNCNDERMQVQDQQTRVSAYDVTTKTWRVANDPQPTGDQSDGGSIWPVLGDLLVNTYDVPIGFANVAVGATSTGQWKTDGPLFQRLLETGRQTKDFRAVLWQQGESDVLEKTSTATYVERLIEMRSQANRAWYAQRPWLLAKSTLHPTVYNDPTGETIIRQAIEILIIQHSFGRGPDTDRLDGPNRGPMGSRRHFTGLGQRNAAAMWFAAISEQLDAPQSAYLAQVAILPELHLREPAWASPIVHRESSVLLQDQDHLPTARLAFPAHEIHKVQLASRVGGLQEVCYQEGVHWRLSDNRSILEWIGPFPCEPIREEQLFVPEGSPNSYKHRAGNPQQSLLYAPGKWFHERNLEITYQRADASPIPRDKPTPTLVRSLEKLRNRSKFVLAISGDSISTGLDASGTTMSPPNQPGYPDLIAAQLTKDFGAQLELVNRSVAGWSIANGLSDLDNLVASKPDLLIVAYGMNDVGRRDPAWFADQARKIDAKAKEKLPDLEILWVTPMLGNREWVHTPREMFFEYQKALRQVLSSGDALADVTEVWEILSRQKHDLDYTGNGLNHPNDYGHRIYAQRILQYLVP
ncbi:MAG: GDSL-type esterase/lipase family protein [Pirellula sp.]|jgi:acyl-CoA thioesterase-1